MSISVIINKKKPLSEENGFFRQKRVGLASNFLSFY